MMHMLPSLAAPCRVQGTDPGTDLRATGMFSMLQMLWVCERKPRFMEVLFQMSRNERIGFPLMLIGTHNDLLT